MSSIADKLINEGLKVRYRAAFFVAGIGTQVFEHWVGDEDAGVSILLQIDSSQYNREVLAWVQAKGSEESIRIAEEINKLRGGGQDVN